MGSIISVIYCIVIKFGGDRVWRKWRNEDFGKTMFDKSIGWPKGY